MVKTNFSLINVSTLIMNQSYSVTSCSTFSGSSSGGCQRLVILFVPHGSGMWRLLLLSASHPAAIGPSMFSLYVSSVCNLTFIFLPPPWPARSGRKKSNKLTKCCLETKIVCQYGVLCGGYNLSLVQKTEECKTSNGIHLRRGSTQLRLSKCQQRHELSIS